MDLATSFADAFRRRTINYRPYASLSRCSLRSEDEEVGLRLVLEACLRWIELTTSSESPEDLGL